MPKFSVPDVAAPPPTVPEEGATPRFQFQKLVTPILAVVTVVSLTGNVLQKYNARLSRPVVTVGSDQVSKFEYQNALDEQAGAQVLRKQVFADLVRQAAAKAHVMPTDREVDARLADLQSRTPQLVPSQNPAQLKRFREDLRADIALENLRMKDVTVTDAEVAAFYSRYRAAFAVPAQAHYTLVVTEHDVDAQRATQLLQQNATPEAIAQQPRMHVAGVNGYSVNMPPALSQSFTRAMLAMKPGQVKTLAVPTQSGDKAYLTFKVKSLRPAVLPPLSQIRDQVTRQAKLAKAVTPQSELASLYQANPPRFDIPKYQAFFTDVQNFRPGADVQKTASAQ